MKTIGLCIWLVGIGAWFMPHLAMGSEEYRVYSNDGKNAGVIRRTAPNTWTRYRPDWTRDGVVQRNTDGSFTGYDNSSKRIETYRPTSKPVDSTKPAERSR